MQIITVTEVQDFVDSLDKGFHTVNGLTHVFVYGVPLDIVPDDAE